MEAVTRWRWSNSLDRPVEVKGYPTGRADHLFVPDADDFQGGKLIHASGLFETAERAINYEVGRQEGYLRSTQLRLERLREQLRKARLVEADL